MLPSNRINKNSLHVSPADFFQPHSIVSGLAKALVYATPKQQRNMLGGCLYPLVEELEPLWTADVTGMLLELDQSIILHLIESSDALKAHVKEAIKVLSDLFPEQMLLMSSTKPMRVKSGVSTYFGSDCRLPQGTYWVSLAFVYATPERQRDMLGECLFPLVSQSSQQKSQECFLKWTKVKSFI